MRTHRANFITVVLLLGIAQFHAVTLVFATDCSDLVYLACRSYYGTEQKGLGGDESSRAERSGSSVGWRLPPVSFTQCCECVALDPRFGELGFASHCSMPTPTPTIIGTVPPTVTATSTPMPTPTATVTPSSTPTFSWTPPAATSTPALDEGGSMPGVIVTRPAPTQTPTPASHSSHGPGAAASGDLERESEGLSLVVYLKLKEGAVYDPEFQTNYLSITDYTVVDVLRLAQTIDDSQKLPTIDPQVIGPTITILHGEEIVIETQLPVYTHPHDTQRFGVKRLRVDLPAEALKGDRIRMQSGPGEEIYSGSIFPLSYCDSKVDGRCDPNCGMAEFDGITDPDCLQDRGALCSNGELDEGERGIDCGSTCENECACTDEFIAAHLGERERAHLGDQYLKNVLVHVCHFVPVFNRRQLAPFFKQPAN